MDTSIKKPSGSDSVETIKASLTALGLPPVGKKETLLKRLKRAWFSLSTSAAQTEQDESDLAEKARVKQAELEAKDFHDTPRGRYKAFLVLDIEGTCESGKGFDFPNEVIEFPVVLVKWRPVSASSSPAPASDDPLPPRHQQELYVHDSFQTYIRPVWRPKLTNFATSLTGITQSQVDSAPTFLDMLPSFLAWLKKHGLAHLDGDDSERDWLWVTDGPFDLRDFVAKQSFISKIPHPWYLAGDVLDLKDAVAALLKQEWEDKGGFDAPVESAEPAAESISTTPLSEGDVALLKTEEGGSASALPSVELGPVVEVPPPVDATTKTALVPSEDPLIKQLQNLQVDDGASDPSLSHPSAPAASDASSSSPPSTSIPVTTTLPHPPPVDSSLSTSSSPLASTSTTSADPSQSPARNKKRKGRSKGKPKPPSFFFNVTEILRRLDLGAFEGRQHSGIDDARNIARILIEVERRGILLQPNRFIRPGDRKWAWMGEGYKIEWGKAAQE